MNKIKQFRDIKNIKQVELAMAIGWPRARLSNYENLQRQIVIENGWKIVTGLNRLGVECDFKDVFPPQKDIAA